MDSDQSIVEKGWKQASEFELLATLAFINISAINLPWWPVSLSILVLSAVGLGVFYALFRFSPAKLSLPFLRFAHRMAYDRLEVIGVASWLLLFFLSLFSPNYVPSYILAIFSLCSLSLSFLLSFQARLVFSLSSDQRERFEMMSVQERLKSLFSSVAYSVSEDGAEDMNSFTALEKHFSKAAQEKRAIDELRSDKMVKKDEHYELDKERESWEFEVSSRYEEWISKEKTRLRGREGENVFR